VQRELGGSGAGAHAVLYRVVGILDYLPKSKPIGTIDVRRPDRNATHLVARCIASLVVFAVWTWGLIQTTDTSSQFAFAVAMSVTYLIVATCVYPEPEMSNVGLWGPFIDHPFRFSDGINRFLLFLMVLLLPGRLVGTTAVDLWRLSRSEPGESEGAERTEERNAEERRNGRKGENYR
jgi:hypothetical protein